MKLDYGKNGIEVEIDPKWNTKIIHPVEQFVRLAVSSACRIFIIVLNRMKMNSSGAIA